MSEIYERAEASAVPARPTLATETTGLPLDFAPLLGQDTEDFDLAAPPTYHARRRRPWLLFLLIGLLVILLGGSLLTYRLLARPPAVQYTQAAATIGNLTVAVSGTGPVQAGAIYNLNFAASAPVQTINVQVGQHVTRGQVLATLNPTTLQDAVNQASNSVSSAQTAVNNAQSALSTTRTQQNLALDIAKITEKNNLASCETTGSPGGGGGGGGTTSPPSPAAVAACKKLVTDQYNQAVNQAHSAIASAQNQVSMARQQLTNAQTALQTAQDTMANASLMAPHDGVIEAINGLVGENASGSAGSSASGSAGSSAFMVLVDTSTLSIAAQVNEANIAAVATDQPAQFTVPAYPSQTFHASVTSINMLGLTSSSVVTFQVNLAVDMHSIGSLHVYPGMTATVTITTAERIGALLIPSSALSFAATALQNGELDRTALRSLIAGGTARTGASGNQGIVVELKGGKLVPVLVTTGLTNGQQTEILSGLQEGNQVVTAQTGATTTTSSATNGRGIFGGGGRGGGNFTGGN
jgi:multidrug efflux pump subunit AcrA (membrane-fusion protein)